MYKKDNPLEADERKNWTAFKEQQSSVVFQSPLVLKSSLTMAKTYYQVSMKPFGRGNWDDSEASIH